MGGNTCVYVCVRACVHTTCTHTYTYMHTREHVVARTHTHAKTNTYARAHDTHTGMGEQGHVQLQAHVRRRDVQPLQRRGYHCRLRLRCLESNCSWVCCMYSCLSCAICRVGETGEGGGGKGSGVARGRGEAPRQGVTARSSNREGVRARVVNCCRAELRRIEKVVYMLLPSGCSPPDLRVVNVSRALALGSDGGPHHSGH